MFRPMDPSENAPFVYEPPEFITNTRRPRLSERHHEQRSKNDSSGMEEASGDGMRKRGRNSPRGDPRKRRGRVLLSGFSRDPGDTHIHG